MHLCNEPEEFDDLKLSVFSELLGDYTNFRKEHSEGKYGKTPQFWLIYLELMKFQRQAHTAVQTNDFEMRLDAWERMLPYYFYFNKNNYARYGSYYVQMLKCIDDNYEGLKDLLSVDGLSVQAQKSHPLRTSIDQRGEQTINRDAKTAGEYYVFSPSSL